jgi:hypothetical protein
MRNRTFFLGHVSCWERRNVIGSMPKKFYFYYPMWTNRAYFRDKNVSFKFFELDSPCMNRVDNEYDYEYMFQNPDYFCIDDYETV